METDVSLSKTYRRRASMGTVELSHSKKVAGQNKCSVVTVVEVRSIRVICRRVHGGGSGSDRSSICI